jgi:PAS domain S-box-containing protein
MDKNLPSTIVARLPLQVWTARPDGALDYVNPFVADFFGLPQEQLLEDGWRDVVHPSDLLETARSWSHSLETGEDYEIEFRLLRHADRQYRWHSARASAIHDANGQIIKWVGVNIDIDVSKRAEEVRQAATEQVRMERERVRSLFAQSPVAISVTSGPQHRLDQVNDRARQLIGGRNIEGRTVREALPELDGQGIIELLDQVYRTGEPFEGKEVPVRFRRTDDGPLEDAFFNFTYQPLFDPQGQIYGIISASFEVTEQVRLRQEVERLQGTAR